MDWTNGAPRLAARREARSSARTSRSRTTQHLARKGIKGPDGDEVLQCANCHQPESSGRADAAHPDGEALQPLPQPAVR